MPPLVIMVVGECGDGKSTLVGALAQGKCKRQPETGMAPGGVTKKITLYNAGKIGGRDIVLADTPGVGDRDITPGKLVDMITTFLASEQVKVNGVLLCSSISKNRVTLGAQVISKLAELSFQGRSKWDDFIFVGTQKDRCKRKEIENFKTQTLAELNRLCSGSVSKVAAVSIDEDSPSDSDLRELFGMIQSLAGNVVAFQKPDSEVLAKELGKILSVRPRDLAREVVVYRHVTVERESGCFPGSCAVRVLSGHGAMAKVETLAMRELRVGQQPLTASLRGHIALSANDVVVGWYDNYGEDVSRNFAVIHHEHGSLALTENHLLFVLPAGCDAVDQASAIQAANVQVGMSLLVCLQGIPAETLALSKVSSTDVQRLAGIYSPATMTGRLVVDGVLVSAYAKPAAFKDLDVSDARVNQMLHFFSSPLRFCWWLRASVLGWPSVEANAKPKGADWFASWIKRLFRPLLSPWFKSRAGGPLMAASS